MAMQPAFRKDNAIDAARTGSTMRVTRDSSWQGKVYAPLPIQYADAAASRIAIRALDR
jgi:hypothetical protein